MEKQKIINASFLVKQMSFRLDEIEAISKIKTLPFADIHIHNGSGYLVKINLPNDIKGELCDLLEKYFNEQIDIYAKQLEELIK